MIPLNVTRVIKIGILAEFSRFLQPTGNGFGGLWGAILHLCISHVDS
jgi:hypothetical protein